MGVQSSKPQNIMVVHGNGLALFIDGGELYLKDSNGKTDLLSNYLNIPVGVTPTLQEVTNEGATTDNSMDITTDAPADFQVKTQAGASGFYIDNTGYLNTYNGVGYIDLDPSTGKILIQEINNATLTLGILATANRAINFPDASGTVALTSDIVAPTLQVVLDTGDYAESPNSNSYFQVLLDNGFPLIDVYMEDQFNKFGLMTVYSNNIYMAVGDDLTGNNVSLNLEEDDFSVLFEAGGFSTTLNFITPTSANAVLRFPAKATGTYTIATLDDLTLQSATNGGNTTDNSIRIVSGGYALFEAYDLGSTTGVYLDNTGYFGGFNGNNYIDIDPSSSAMYFGIGATTLTLGTLHTANRAINFPDASGTIALTSDIDVPTLQEVFDTQATVIAYTESTDGGTYMDYDMSPAGAGYIDFAVAVSAVSTFSSFYLDMFEWRVQHRDLSTSDDRTEVYIDDDGFHIEYSDNGNINTIEMAVPTALSTQITFPAPNTLGNHYIPLAIDDNVADIVGNIAILNTVTNVFPAGDPLTLTASYIGEFNWVRNQNGARTFNLNLNATTPNIPTGSVININNPSTQGTITLAIEGGVTYTGATSIPAGSLFTLRKVGTDTWYGTAMTSLDLGGYTVGTLPAGSVGMRAYVTDATAPTFLGALTGGGAVITPVFHNGTAWVSA